MRTFNIKVNGVPYEVEVEETGSASASVSSAETASAAASVPSPKPETSAGGSIKVKAPMPGKLVKINCKTGQSVKRGEILCLLEAMKMENEILAAHDGVIASVNVEKGAAVNSGDVLGSYK